MASFLKSSKDRDSAPTTAVHTTAPKSSVRQLFPKLADDVLSGDAAKKESAAPSAQDSAKVRRVIMEEIAAQQRGLRDRNTE